MADTKHEWTLMLPHRPGTVMSHEIEWTDETWNPWWGCNGIAECRRHAQRGRLGLLCCFICITRCAHTYFRGAAAGWDAMGRFLACEPFFTPIVWLNGI